MKTNLFYFLRKMTSNLITYLITVLSILLIFVLVFFVYFQDVFIDFQIEYINIKNTAAISQLNLLTEELGKTMYQISSDKSVKMLLEEEQYPIERFFEVFNRVQRYLTETPMTVKNFVVINESTNKVHFVSNVPVSLDKYEKENHNFRYIMDKANKNNKLIKMPDGETVAFVYKSSGNTKFIAEFDGYNIASVLDEADYPFPMVTYFFGGEERDLISHAQYGDIELLNIPQKFYKSTSECGSFISGNAIYAYKNTAEFSCMSAMKLSTVFKRATNTLLFWGVFCVVLLIFFGMTTFFFYSNQRRNLQKHSKLVDDLNKETDKLHSDNVLYRLFNGESIESGEKQFVSSYFKLEEGYSCFGILIEIDDYSDFSINNSYNDVLAVKYGICNITAEILNEIGICKCISVTASTLAALISIEEERYSDKWLYDLLIKVKDNIKEIFDISLSIVIGKPNDSTENLINQLPDIFSYVDYMFIRGKGCIINTKNVPELHDEEETEQLKIAVIGAVCAGKAKQYQAALDDICTYFENRYIVNVKQWCINLAYEIVNSAKGAGLMYKRDIINTVILSNSLCNVMEVLAECIQFEDAQMSPEDEANKIFIAKVQEITKEQFKNLDLNINYVAREMNLSSGYVGRKFSKLFNISYTSYLLEYRMNHAIELLKDDRNSIAVIAQECGFSSETYFMTKFKKYMGMTPTEYRNNFLRIKYINNRKKE